MTELTNGMPLVGAPVDLTLQQIERFVYGCKDASLSEYRFAYKLLSTLQENESLKLENELALNSCAELAGEVAKMWAALQNAREIIRVENLLERWPENIKIIDAALSNEVSDGKNS